jgi:hypothetical protein
MTTEKICEAYDFAYERALKRFVLEYGDHVSTTEREAFRQGFSAGWLACTSYVQQSRETASA